MYPFDAFAAAELLNWKVVGATGSIPKPAWIGPGEPVSDGEMDTDGAVHSASALGFTLGRVPFPAGRTGAAAGLVQHVARVR